MVQFSATFFKNNRQRLKELVEADVYVFTANGQLQRNGDCAYPFRQDSNFWYLTGLDTADTILVMTADQEWIIVPNRSDYEELFETDVDSKTIKSTSGVAKVMNAEDGWNRLVGLLGRKTRVATALPPDEFLEVYSLHTNPARHRLVARLREAGVKKLIDTRQELANLRMIKQPVEITAIREAVDITVETLKDIHHNLNKYNNERDIDTALYSGYRSRGASGHSFNPIVASGANACTLHYMANDTKLTKHQFVLIDSGAEVSHYAADITRCYPVSSVSQRHREIYTAVYEAQLAGIAALKPGIVFKAADDAVCRSLEKSLKQLKLRKHKGKSLVRSYYPHASHHLGLDVHDVADYKRPLEPGMLVTMEPGIYIETEGIGVRLEDDILITKTGCQVLSQQLPIAPDDIFGK